MPQAVAAWIATSLGVAAGTTASALIQAGTAIAFNLALSRVTQPKGRSPKDNQVEIRQSDAPRTRYVGRNRVSGAVMYWETHDKALWKLWAVVQGGHNGVLQWHLGDRPVSVVDGTVMVDHFYGHVQVWSRTGKGAERAGGAYPQLIAPPPPGASRTGWMTSARS